MADGQPSTLAIIAGGGRLPAAIAGAALADGRKVVVFGLSGEFQPEEADLPPQAVLHKIKWGEIGRLFDLMKREAVEDIILAGSVSRPHLADIKFDTGALLSLPRLAQILIGGDDAVLVKLVRFIEERGFRVRGAHEVAPALLATAGTLTRKTPSEADWEDIRRGLEAARQLGSLDIGQASITVHGRVVAVEGIEGTDQLIARTAQLRTSGRLKAKSGEGVLVKCAKPQQDLRVDMPTIGLATVEAVKAAGLSGIAIEAGRVLVLDKAALLAAADAAGLFVIAV